MSAMGTGRVLFRADSSPVIGTGHLMRCLTLARELRRLGQECAFVARSFPGTLASLISEAGFAVHLLETDAGSPPVAAKDHASWVGASEVADSDAFIEIAQNFGADLAIADHYGLGATWESRVRKSVPRVMALDDLCREHDCDLLLDPTLGREPADYEGKGAGACLTGVDHALLRDEFALWRDRLIHAPDTAQRNGLLVNLGGSDPDGVTLSILEALARADTLRNREIIVVLSAASPAHEAVSILCRDLGAEFHARVDDMASLMARCCLAIGASGGTAWERCALGLPTLIVPIADNQMDNAQALEACGAGMLLMPGDIANRLAPLLANMEQGLEARSRRAMGICDALGARRTALHLVKERLRTGEDLTLRRATMADAELVLGWQSEPGARRHSRNPAVPAREEHMAWMARRLGDPACHFHIMEADGEAAGFVRLEGEQAGRMEVSILVASAFQGRGAGSAALAAMKRLHREWVIEATVLSENAASMRMFEKAGFRPSGMDRFEWRGED